MFLTCCKQKLLFENLIKYSRKLANCYWHKKQSHQRLKEEEFTHNETRSFTPDNTVNCALSLHWQFQKMMKKKRTKMKTQCRARMSSHLTLNIKILLSVYFNHSRVGDCWNSGKTNQVKHSNADLHEFTHTLDEGWDTRCGDSNWRGPYACPTSYP